MAATPNPKVTIPGSGVLSHVLNTSGLPVPVQGDDDGSVNVNIVSGSGGVAINQGTGNAASPWYVQPKLSSTGPVPLAPKTVPTGTAEAIVSVSTPVTRMVRLTSDFANTKTVYVSGTGVTVANGQPLGPGDVYTRNDIDNANLIFCISADAAQVLRIEVL